MVVRRLVWLALLCAVMDATLAAHGENPAAFDRRCMLVAGVVPQSNTTGMLPRRGLPAGRVAGLGATEDLYYGLWGNRQLLGPGDLIDSVLAVVEGQVITLSEVRAFLDLRLIEQPDAADPIPPVLTALIERQLILQEVERYVMEEPLLGEVDARLADVVARVGGPEAFEQLLLTVGFTVEDLRHVLRDDLRIKQYLARRFMSAREPTEEEVVAYFREHADEFRRDGVPQSFYAARDEARRRLSDQLRQKLVDDWLASLTVRADVFRVP